MHILVVNDDGPPSNQSSPYVRSLVHSLQTAGHTVSVVLPHVQRSWISKAHIVGQPIKPTYFRPGPPPTKTELNNLGEISMRPLPPNSNQEEWILIDSTPASCVQIGLFHYFQSRGPVDLVVSGPNYGRNTTAVFSLSSGTIGGAMEAAVCGVRSIALSYCFYDRNHNPDVIGQASGFSVKIIEHLAANWGVGVQLYSVNVPLMDKVAERKILWTKMLQNEWKSGSCFQVIKVPAEEDEGAEEAEMQIRKSEEETERLNIDQLMEEGGSDSEDKSNGHIRYQHIHFKWAPRFKDVHDSVDRAPPGNDGWAVREKYTSVTPLVANFWHVDGYEGELKL